MIATVSPSSIRGTIPVPASKSVMQRALAAALIRKGRTRLHHPGHSADDLAALACIRSLGATVRCAADHWDIMSSGIRPTGDSLDCGESGLSMRMFTPLAGVSDRPLRLTGKGSLAGRPMHFFENVLPALGVQVKLNEGCLPIEVCGPLQPRNLRIDGSLSSQFLTGLLMAYASVDAGEVVIEVSDLKSRPYIDLTLEVLKQFGLKAPQHDGYQTFSFSGQPAPAVPEVIDFSVEGDWSGAAFWFAAAAIAGPVELTGLDPNSSQADRAIVSVCREAGLEVNFSPNGYRIEKGSLRPVEFDATDCPDLFPPLLALASYLPGVSVLHGADRLIHKESDRARVLKSEFGKLGVGVEITGNSLRVQGGGRVCGTKVLSQGDHRIAMALAVAALGASGAVAIDGAEAVAKSYPDFWMDLRSVGASLSLSE